MKKNGIVTYLTMMFLLFLGACHTVGDQAPVELKEADAAIKKARAADVEDYMPSAMEAAERKLDKAVDLLDDSTGYSKDGVEGQAKSAQVEAIGVANEAKAIAQAGTKIVKDMKAFDTNSGQYLASKERTAKSDAYQAQMSNLENKLSDANSENQKLANKPAEETIPADFRIGKPVAYFTTGSTVLSAKYRAEVEELARLVQKNQALNVKLEGFADPRGSVSINKKLADKRIQAVADVLQQNGVASERIEMVPVGATADSSTASGAGSGALQLDRRVTATMTISENTPR